MVMGFSCCRNYWKPQVTGSSGLADSSMQVYTHVYAVRVRGRSPPSSMCQPCVSEIIFEGLFFHICALFQSLLALALHSHACINMLLCLGIHAAAADTL